MTRTKHLLIVIALNIVWGTWSGTATAAPITTGTWSTIADPTAFWNNVSNDGPNLNAGTLLSNWAYGLEYLHAGGAPVAFAFDQPEFFTEILSITSWMDGRGLTQLANGSLTFTSHGYTYNTLTTPNQFALFRAVTPSMVIYYLGVEDIPPGMASDHDYNDYIGYAIDYLPPPPTPSPEPGTLALVMAGGAVAWRKMRSARA